MKEWKDVPSGSAAKRGRPPTQYKYASDMSFLKKTLSSAATTDNIELDDENVTPAASVQVETLLLHQSVIGVTIVSLGEGGLQRQF